MPQLRTSRLSSPKLRVALLAIATVALIGAGAGAQAQAGQAKRVVKQAHSAKLGKTILTTLRGITLYSLSAESNGKFICKRGCLRDWHPLFIAAGVKPTGPVRLGAIRRPDSGRRQVTFDGLPLYTFDEDKAAGDVKGQGFKDVGTWRAATPGA